MSSFISYILEKEPQYKGFKLQEVVYNKKNATISFLLLYPDEFGVLQSNNKKKIVKYFKQYLGAILLGISVSARFKRSYFSEDYIKEVLLEKIAKKHPVYFKVLKFDDLKIDKDKDVYNLTLLTINDSAPDDKIEQIKKDIEKVLASEFCYEFSLKLKKIDSSIDQKDDEPDVLDDQEDFYNSEFEKSNAKVVKLEQVTGTKFESSPECVFSVSKPGKSKAIVGSVENFQAREYSKRNGDSGEDKRTFYSFNLTMDGDTIRAVYFPKNGSTLENIQDFDEIVVIGDVENFHGALSLKADHIAKVKITYRPENQIRYKPAPREYRRVSPDKVEVVEQSNLFEKEDKYPKSVYDNTFVVFDLETTGLSYQDCEIIEIGAVKIKKGKIVEKFSSFVNPDSQISMEITKITSITNSMVKDAPKISEVIPDFYKFCAGSVLLAYNIDFDYGFLNHFGKKAKYNFSNKKRDVLILAQKKVKGLKNYKLKTVAESLNINLTNAHRAYYDAIATAKIFLTLVKDK